MKQVFNKFSNFWFQAHWVTKIFIALIALMVTFRVVTSCIRVGIIDLEIGCDDPALYEDGSFEGLKE
jgi:hypothetical protein